MAFETYGCDHSKPSIKEKAYRDAEEMYRHMLIESNGDKEKLKELNEYIRHYLNKLSELRSKTDEIS